MFNIIRKTIEWEGRSLTIETGKVARQADGAVMVQYGETVVLCTVVSAKEQKEGVDFFPLTVIYQEKSFAAGRIPGGFFKREGRPSEKEVLTSRLIDRPIRPLFHEHFFNETQVICTVLSHDMENDPDIVALIGASAAIAIAGLPFAGPVAAARVAYIDGNYIVNPPIEIISQTQLDLVVAGTKNSVLMVESQAQELSEDVMIGAVERGHAAFQPVIRMIQDIAEEANNPTWKVEEPDTTAIDQAIRTLAEQDMKAAFAIREKQARVNALREVRKKIAVLFEGKEVNSLHIRHVTKALEKEIVRSMILQTKKRIDDRGAADIRSIESEVTILPRTHGSALFTRGETQALVVATLGTGQDEQIIDSLDAPDTRQHFMLHYNFPPYSVGEASPMRAPGRREVGHGKLAWRALQGVLPSKEEFPYTIRLVSEITESNGSSSMATVCGASLALMDAGVPVKTPVAGIAMGLIIENSHYVVLSDITGDEDHLGEMDFKVAGTKDGVTALQMDIKIQGITFEIMKNALKQAHEGRLHILDEMAKTLTQSREGLNKNAPTITTVKIHKDKIREVIGSGGKVIREICEVSGAKIDIDDDGTIKIAAISAESKDKAMQMIANIVTEPEVGKVYHGKVVKIMEFGAFVNFMGAHDGLVHISEMALERVANVTDMLNEGDMIDVKLIGMERGKYKLSMKALLPGGESSESSSDDKPRESRERRQDRPRRK